MTVCTMLPLTPFIVRAYVPVFVLLDVEIRKVEELVAGLGLNEALVPPGRPVTLKLTALLNPPEGLIVIV